MIKEFLSQELDNLNEEQLKQVADFIALIKFRARCVRWTAAESQLATLYSEAEEDQRLAEEGLDEYAELLRKEDLQ